jgi:DUF4097 and DUF4098 domain-containing protein YvlB
MTIARILAPIASVVVCLGLAAEGASLSNNRTETRTEKLAYGAKLWVKNRNGAIRVTGWDKEEVSLTADIRDSDKRRIELTVAKVGADLDIEAHFQQPVISFSFGFASSPKCEMTLSVPHRLLAHFRTTNGPVSVANLEGYARVETTNGDITLRNLQGEVQAETTNGSVEAHTLKARLKGGTTNGRLILEDVDGMVKMETTNGTIKAKNLDGWGEGITLESTNGSIDLELGRATGDIHAENANGSIEIKVPGAQVVEISKHSAHVKVAGKNQKIALETTNGSIRIH